MGTRSALIAHLRRQLRADRLQPGVDRSFTTKAIVDTNAKRPSTGTFDITFDVVTQKGTFTGTFSAAVCPNAKDNPLTAVACD